MAYARLNIAAALAAALRAMTGHDDLQNQVNDVRGKLDGLTEQVTAVTARLEQNGAADAEDREVLEGITAELRELADVLTGPADDDSDNGVIGEVSLEDNDVTSPSVDAVLAGTGDGTAGEAVDTGSEAGEDGSAGADGEGQASEAVDNATGPVGGETDEG